MVKVGARAVVVGLGALATLAAAWAWLGPAPAAVGARGAGDAASTKGDDIPRIDLARIDAKASPSEAGNTDVFEFGAPAARGVERTAPPTIAVAPPATAAAAPDAAPTPTAVPVLNVKYIGSLDDKKGLKVAVLMTERKEVLTGRAGDVVANRLKIVTIGLESVDVQDLGSDRIRRIPLRAN